MQVKVAKEQEMLSRAFHQWQLQSLRSRIECVTKALAARENASPSFPAMTNFSAAHHHFPVAAIATMPATCQAPPRLEIAALDTVWSGQASGFTAAMTDTKTADVRQAMSEEAFCAALCTRVVTEEPTDGPGTEMEGVSATEEPACFTACSEHHKPPEQASPEALPEKGAANLQGASSAAPAANGEAVPMDLSTMWQSVETQNGGSQTCQGQAVRVPSGEAIQQEALEQMGEAGTKSGSALCAEDAAESAGSGGDMPHPDDDGLHDWLRSSCIGNAEDAVCDKQVSITDRQQDQSQGAAAIDRLPARLEHRTGDGPEAAPQLDLGSSGRNGPAPILEPVSTAGQAACADDLDSPGSPREGRGQMSAQDVVFVTPPAAGAASTAPGDTFVGLPAITSFSTSMDLGVTALSACSVEPAGNERKSTVAPNACVQRVQGSEEEGRASTISEKRHIGGSPCTAEHERSSAMGGNQRRTHALNGGAQALMGSPGLPTAQIAPMVCAALRPGGVPLPAMFSDALASPLTLTKRPPAGCARFALGQPPAVLGGASPEGRRRPGMPFTAPQCRWSSRGRLSQDDSSSGSSSGQVHFPGSWKTFKLLGCAGNRHTTLTDLGDQPLTDMRDFCILS